MSNVSWRELVSVPHYVSLNSVYKDLRSFDELYQTAFICEIYDMLSLESQQKVKDRIKELEEK